jgi:phage-related protein
VTLIAGLVAALVVLWNTNEDFRNALISAWETIKETASSVFTAVANFFTETIPNAFQSMVDWIREGISSFISIGSEILTGIYNGIVGSVQNLYEAAKTIILTLAENIIGSENLEKIISVGGDLINSLIEGVENVIDTLTSVGEDIVNSIKQGISDAWEGLKTWFNNLWDSLFKNRKVDVDVNASGGGSTYSNANGISYVPYDGYYSVLHKGERVLTAEENKAYNRGATGNTSGITIIQNIQTVPQTPVEFAAATEAYFEQARWAFA